MKAEALKQWRRQRKQRRLIIAGLCVALLAVAVGAALFWPFGPSNTVRVTPRRVPPAGTANADPLNLPAPDLLKPIPPEEALKENAERPFSGRADTRAAAFKLKTDAASSERALECLSQAVYYEAASEGADGQRAVAQIVLNRMRHPGYPASVCGVVYQGSERVTGCQFTFTCDGSLARVPAASLWKQARQIAKEALAGKVYAPVGHATHYHADYVLPYWADSLDKSAKVGRHIFYRLKGGLGSAAAFSQRYAGSEPAPPLPSTIEVALEAVQEADPILTAPLEENALQVPSGELIKTTETKPSLVADDTQGKLLLDGDATRADAGPVRPRSTTSDDCSGTSGGKKLKPMSANDVRAQGASGGC